MVETSRRESLISTLAVMGATLVSRLLGFVRIALVSMFFGASGLADILNAVFNIPNNFRKLLAEGALSSAFIPELSKQIAKEPSDQEASRLVRQILTLQVLILLPLCLLAIFFPRFFLTLFIRFEEVWKWDHAVDLFRWMFQYLLLISVSALFMAVLNSHSRFLLPALSPPLFSVAVILVLILGHQKWGIFAMVLGVLLGGLAQVFIQYPLYRRLGYSLWPLFDFSSPPFLRVLKGWLPALLTSSIFMINQQVAILLATGLDDGSTTALSNAIVFWQLPFGIFSASITTVLFPKMSRQGGFGDWEGLFQTLQQGVHMLGMLLIPSSLLLWLLGPEMISTALQRGKFGPEDAALTALVLAGYAPGMFFVGCYNFLQRFFYSQGQYAFPCKVALGTVLLDIGLSLLFLHLSFGVEALAWANSLAFFIGSTVMMGRGLWRKPGYDLRVSLSHFSRVLAAQLPMVTLLWGLKKIFPLAGFYAGSSWLNMGVFMLEGVLALGVLFFFYSLFKIDILQLLKRKRGLSL